MRALAPLPPVSAVYLLPEKLDSHLRRRRAQRRHVAAQGRQQAGQEPAAHSAPSSAHLPEQVLKRRRQEVPGLKARAAKVRPSWWGLLSLTA